MSRKIKATYDQDQQLGDNTPDGIVAGDDGSGTPVAFDMDQIAKNTGLDERVSALETGTTPPPVGSDAFWTASINNNTLIANLLVTDFTGDAWAITADTAIAPTYPGDFTLGSPPAAYQSPTAAYATTETWRLWQYTIATATTTEVLTTQSVSGILITPTATLPPAAITDFVINDASITATTVEFSCSSTTIIDGIDLTYDILDTVTGNVLLGDFTPGVGVEITGLSPSTDYSPAVNVYPASNSNDTTTRASTTDPDTFTTSAIGTITVFTVADVNDTGGPANATVALTASSGAIDEAILQVDDPTPPAPNSTAWDTIANWVSGGVDVVTYGIHTVYAWARDASFPTSITPIASDGMTATDTGGGVTIIGFEDSTLVTYEERASTISITLNRSGDVSGASSVIVTNITDDGLNPAIVGEHFQAVNSTISFAATETSATVPLSLLYADLGFNEVSLTLELSGASGATLDASTTQIQVTIEGTKGYWSADASAIGTRDGDIDIDNPPTLPSTLPRTLTGTEFETISGFTIDAQLLGSNAANAVICGEGVANKTIENCIIQNAGEESVLLRGCNNVTVRNNLIRNGSNWDVPRWKGAAVHITGLNVTDPSTINVLGNKSLNNNNAFYVEYGTMSDIKINWNYHTNDGTADSFMDGGSGKTNRMIGQQWTTHTGHEFQGNICYHPTVYEDAAFNMDVINNYTTGNTSGSPGLIRFNVIRGNSQTPSTSGLAIIIGDNGVAGYWTCEYNIVIDTGNTGVGMAGGRNEIISHNDLYMSTFFPNKVTAGVGLYAWRQPRAGVPEAAPGTMFNCEISYNRVLWYNSTPAKNLQWFPATGSDGLLPNHGSVVGASNQAITGWSTTNIDMESLWGNGVGDSLVTGRLHVLTQPAYDEGIYVMWASHGSTVGDGRLVYNNAADTLTWSEFGDSSGTAVDLTGSGITDATDERFEIFSGNGNSIVVHITSADLPVADTEWTVNVTKFKLWEKQMYTGQTGTWAGGGGSAPGDVTPPSVPINGAAAPGAVTPATTLDLTWDQSTGTPAGYFIYLSGILIQNLPGNPASPAWTHTGLTEDVSYSYQVASYDAAGNVSEKSDFFSGTPTAGTNLITNGEFQDTSAWTVANGTFTVTAGVAEITNDVAGTPNCRLYNTTPLVLSGSTSYTLTLAHRGEYNNTPLERAGRVVIYQGSNNQYNTNMTSGGSATYSTDITMTEHVMVFTTPATANDISVILWVNDPDAGGFTRWDYMRLEAT